jgi:RNA polymerase sigma-70 factor (ECF subfamily)
MSEAPTSRSFAPTRWTLVVRARGETSEARAALAELCEMYYQPVLRFLRREGRDEDGAREAAQEFFARVLRSSGFSEADPNRGRFRSYLLGALKHFLADQRKHERRLKRGGGQTLDSLHPGGGSGESNADQDPIEIPDSSTPAPNAAFDREWALEVMARALERLKKEFAAEGKALQFDVLKPWLVGEAASLLQADAARQLETTEGAVKVMIHRLRKRFREVVRSEIGQTLHDTSQVDEELRHLIEALS